MPNKKTVLELAIEAVDDRGSKYGHPADHFGRTTGLINALFTEKVRARLDAGLPMFEDKDWGYMMICDKLGREFGLCPVIDNLIDIPGYSRTIEKILQRRAEEARTAEEVAKITSGAFSGLEYHLPSDPGEPMVVAKHNPEGMPVLVVSDEVPD